MLAELDVLIFVKSGVDLQRTAQQVFGALNAAPEEAQLDGTSDPSYVARGLGLQAELYANTGEVLDPEFEEYRFALEISSQYWCVDLDTLDLERALSEYYARFLAFELSVETATEVFLETTEEAEVYEIRSFRRNPQYRLDQAPTTPKVFVVETREVVRPFEDAGWEEADEEEDDLPGAGENGGAGDSEDDAR